MSTPAFQSAKKSFNIAGVNLTSFNEPISSGSFMEVGRHTVTVESAEGVEGKFGPQVVVNWKRDDGASIRQYIPVLFEDKQTKSTHISKLYNLFSTLFAKDITFKSTFFLEEVMNDTTKFGALAGLKADIVVTKGKKGVDLVSEPTSGGYIVVDVETGTRALEPVFMSIKDAAQAAKDAALTRAYNGVSTMIPIEAEVTKNEQALRTALAASASAPSAKTLQAVNML